jgi:hypothetical protein
LCAHCSLSVVPTEKGGSRRSRHGQRRSLHCRCAPQMRARQSLPRRVHAQALPARSR